MLKLRQTECHISLIMMYNLKANPFPRNDLDLVSCELGLENDDYDDNNDNNKEIKIVELF